MTLLALIARELRVAARHGFTYYLRVLGAGTVMLVCIIFGLNNEFKTNLGGELFVYLHATLFCAIWILVPLLTADCISRERREGTLGLLFLTRLRAADIVVPDVLDAVVWLTADLSGPFFRVPGCEDRVVDRRNGVKVDLLPAGRVLKAGCKVPFPQPTKTTENLQIVDLEELISLKLDSWAGSPLHRHKDKTDVIELIIRRKLPRDVAVASAVRDLYLETWDGLQAEP